MHNITYFRAPESAVYDGNRRHVLGKLTPESDAGTSYKQEGFGLADASLRKGFNSRGPDKRILALCLFEPVGDIKKEISNDSEQQYGTQSQDAFNGHSTAFLFLFISRASAQTLLRRKRSLQPKKYLQLLPE